MIKKMGLIIVVIIIWSYGMMTLSNNQDKRISEYVNQTQLEINAISNRLNQNLDELEVDFKLLYNNAVIHQYLDEVEKYEDIETHQLYETVQETLMTLTENPSYIFAWIANDRASFFLDQGYHSDKDYIVGSRPWYNEAIQQDDMHYGDIYMDIGTDQPIVTLMQSYEEIPYSFVSIDYGFKEFFETLSDINGLFIVDGEKQIIMSNNQAILVGTSLLDYEFSLDDTLAYDDVSILEDDTLTIMQSNQRLDWKLFYQPDYKSESDTWNNEKYKYQIGLSVICLMLIGLVLIYKKKHIETLL